MTSMKQIVVDIGRESLWGGFSGEFNPRCTLKHAIFAERLPLRIHLNELMNNLFTHHLYVAKPKLYHILIVEKILVPRFVRDMLVTVLLRDFQVISVSIQPDLLMGILSSGVSSGTILNIAGNECQSLCFVNGRPLMHTLQETTLGVNHALKAFQQKLEAAMEKSAEASAASAAFHRAACWAQVNEEGAECEVGDCEVLPASGVSTHAITVSGKDRQGCLQSLISGVTADGEWVDEKGGAAGALLESLRLCNNDVRYLAAEHIVIMGGGATIPGLCEAICRHATHLSADPENVSWLQRVVRKLPQQRLQVLPTVFPRSALAWIGGSLFASRKENKATFVTLQDLLSRGKFSTAITNTVKIADGSTIVVDVGKASEKENFLLSAPDWQSLDTKDWVFCQTSVVPGPV